jgi:hypothetical protein
MLWQARHPLELQDQAQGDHSPVDIAASSGGVHLSRDVVPGFALAALGRRARMQRTFAADYEKATYSE